MVNAFILVEYYVNSTTLQKDAVFAFLKYLTLLTACVAIAAETI